MVEVFRRGDRLFWLHWTIYEALSLQIANEARRNFTEQVTSVHRNTRCRCMGAYYDLNTTKSSEMNEHVGKPCDPTGD